MKRFLTILLLSAFATSCVSTSKWVPGNQHLKDQRAQLKKDKEKRNAHYEFSTVKN